MKMSLGRALEIMQDEWLLLLYIGLLLLVLVALLCGDWPVFDGTPVRALHLWIGGGACDCVQKILGMLFGERGVHSYEFVEHICCERPNPILQLFYLFIIVGAFSTFFCTSFKYIPGFYLSSIHRYTGPLAVFIGIGIFLLTSFSDPGTITASNLASHENVYPFDGIIYGEKTCSTCNIPRPARSKHCSICNRCIARFDHHCAWMNACIGANNLRYFLSFLIWHCLLCWYGASVLVAILAGEVKEHRVMQRISFYYGVSSFYEKFPHLLQWLLSFYNVQLLLMLFLGIVSILLAAFLSYHLYLVARNTTTNEVYKWDGYTKWQDYVAQTQAETQESSRGSAPAVEKKRCCLLNCGFWNLSSRRSQISGVKAVRNNIYQRGLLKNFCEVFFPLRKSVREASNKKE